MSVLIFGASTQSSDFKLALSSSHFKCISTWGANATIYQESQCVERKKLKGKRYVQSVSNGGREKSGSTYDAPPVKKTAILPLLVKKPTFNIEVG